MVSDVLDLYVVAFSQCINFGKIFRLLQQQYFKGAKGLDKKCIEGKGSGKIRILSGLTHSDWPVKITSFFFS